MVATRGSGSDASDLETSSTSDEEIRGIIVTKFVAVIREVIPDIFGSIKNTLIAMFDEFYAAVTNTTSAPATAVVIESGLQGGGSMLYRELSNTKPLELVEVKHLITVTRWISDVVGCFYTYSFSENQKVGFTLSLIRLGAKDWWKFATKTYFSCRASHSTWDQFLQMFHVEYVPLVEKEYLA